MRLCAGALTMQRPGVSLCAAALMKQRPGTHHIPISTRRLQLFSFSQAPETAQQLCESVQKIYTQQLIPLNAKLAGPLEASSDSMLPLPMVLVIGNHSSGKSTFINFLCGANIQQTGVAPTDDAFTVIAPGREDADQDGPALIGDPLMGLAGLSQFGRQLENHVRLKIRKATNLKELIVVDSPGMIDSPQPTAAFSRGFDRGHERGYDFAGAVRFFAEKADVVLLFFDPDKPGTTAESLQVLTTSLAGSQHKLHIILNKADKFSTVHDFARAYGALCWNLSKVIPRKDLPPIYTMNTPIPTTDGATGVQSGMLKEAQAELDRSRVEIVSEVFKAPLRRVDNAITRLHDATRLLRMHAVVLGAVKSDYTKEVIRWSAMVASGVIGLATLSTSLIVAGVTEVGVPLAVLSVLASGAGAWYANSQVEAKARSIIDGAGLDEAFRRCHYLALSERNEVVSQLWERVRPQLQRSVRGLGFRGLASAKRYELSALDEIIDKRVPELRAAASKAGALYSSAVPSDLAAANKDDGAPSGGANASGSGASSVSAASGA